MGASFRDSIKAICTPFLLGFNGERIGYACTVVLDALSESIREGIRAHMPGLGTPTALGPIGEDREIDRGPTESDANYAERLRTALQSYQTAGSAHTLLTMLRAYFDPGFVHMRTVSDRGVWHDINPSTGAVTKTIASPTNWQFDAHAFGVAPAGTQRWRRLWLIIEPTTWKRDVWTSADPYDSIGTWGSTATYAEVLSVRKIAEKWRSGGVQIVNIILAFTPNLFAPGNAPGAPMPAGDFDDPAVRAARDAAFWKGTPK